MKIFTSKQNHKLGYTLCLLITEAFLINKRSIINVVHSYTCSEKK